MARPKVQCPSDSRTNLAALQPNAVRQKRKLPEIDFRKSLVGRGSGGRWWSADVQLTMDSVLSCHSPTHTLLGSWGRHSCLLEIASLHITCKQASGKETLLLWWSCKSEGSSSLANCLQIYPASGGISPHGYKPESPQKITSEFNTRVLRGPWRGPWHLMIFAGLF